MTTPKAKACHPSRASLLWALWNRKEPSPLSPGQIAVFFKVETSLHAEFGVDFKTPVSQHGVAVCLQSYDAEREPFIHGERDFTEASSQILAEGMAPRTAVGRRFVRPAFRCCLLTELALDSQAASLTSFSLSCSAVKEPP